MFKRKGGGGSKAFWKMFKKTALFLHDGFPNDDDCPRKPAIVIANMIVRAICKTKARNRPFILYHKIGEL